jgi:hypothetical protein
MKSVPSLLIAGLCLASVLAGGLTGCSGSDTGGQLSNSKYHAGERWSYKTRAGEENSTLVIGGVEAAAKEGAVVHISIEGLKLTGPEGKTLDHIGHMPMSLEAVDKSVTHLVGQNALPTSDYSAGYDYWKAAGSGGVFAMTVQQAVGYYEKVIQPRPKKG